MQYCCTLSVSSLIDQAASLEHSAMRLCYSNDDFRAAVARQEAQDSELVAAKLQRPLDDMEGARCGVSRLRSFLEELLRQRYHENVPTILALLDKEFRATVRQQPGCLLGPETAQPGVCCVHAEAARAARCVQFARAQSRVFINVNDSNCLERLVQPCLQTLLSPSLSMLMVGTTHDWLVWVSPAVVEPTRDCRISSSSKSLPR